MARKITLADLEDLCRGAAVLGTGGGGDPYIGRLVAAQAMRETGAVDLIDLEELDEDALVTILTEPKNALIRQYKKFFEYEGVKLSIPDETLKVIAHEAIRRETGARGLRSVLESAMLEVMYHIPSLDGVRECIITPGVITGVDKPVLVYDHRTEAWSA